MSLKQAAQHLAAQGRGPDRTLVHMSPREVAGLQAIAKAHGGSLTINPETGLAEAGFLDRMMPTLIGAGLAAATGGTSLALTPGMIGMGVGAFETARTGNLGKGLMAGLGAYGGAGLYGGAEAAGMFGGEQAASTQVPTAGGLAGPAPTPGIENARDELLLRNTGYDNARDQLLARTVPPEQIATQTAMTSPVAPTPMSGMDLAKYGGASMGSMMDTTRPPIPGVEKYDGPLSRYRMSDDYKSYDPQPPNPYYEPQRYTYGMAGGGAVEQMSNANAVGMNTGYPQADITGHAYASPWQTPMSQNVVQGTADTGVNRMTGQMLAEGGMAYAGGGQLGGYSDGGRMLKGPGDGMSDSIPAQIGAKQPARLADGEFVMPADVVSHLGNGSSEAGARQLYKMMDRIRSARTGKKRQAPQINPKRVMAA